MSLLDNDFDISSEGLLINICIKYFENMGIGDVDLTHFSHIILVDFSIMIVTTILLKTQKNMLYM